MSLRLLWQQIPSPLVSEILSYSSFDGVVLDAEHGCFNNETLYSCIQVISRRDRRAFVRVATVDEEKVRMCLDAGATGIIFANIESVDQITKIHSICNYPSRGLGLVRENMWGHKALGIAAPIIIIQIESRKAIDQLPYISKSNWNKLVDYYMIGPYDLSKSYGVAGDFEHRAVKAALTIFEECIPDEKKGYHLVKDWDEYCIRCRKYGMVAMGMDTTMLFEQIKLMENMIS